MGNKKEKAQKRDIKMWKGKVTKWDHGKQNERKIDPLSKEGKTKIKESKMVKK